MRKHCKEIIRFANSKERTVVWYKPRFSNKWDKTYYPAWKPQNKYILEDRYAELRKESIDTGIPIQVYRYISSKWETSRDELDFHLPIEYYRLEPDNYEYPIYQKK